MFCPLIRKECVKHKCAWYTSIQGTNPNTGEPLNREDCIITTLPVLLIENSKQQRSTSAAVESFRNEMVSSNNTIQEVLIHAYNRSIPGTVSPAPNVLPGEI
jgi:hypothetical protein